jgi:hypothetical protein
MTTSTQTTTDFQLERRVAAPAERLRRAIAEVEGWWSTAVDRSGDEFTVHFAENWTRVRDEGRRWIIVGQDTPAIPVPDEWVGDVLTFDVEEDGAEASVLRFTHHDLLAQECESMCAPAWQAYIASLVAYAETGEGNPWRAGMAAGGEEPPA